MRDIDQSRYDEPGDAEAFRFLEADSGTDAAVNGAMDRAGLLALFRGHRKAIAATELSQSARGGVATLESSATRAHLGAEFKEEHPSGRVIRGLFVNTDGDDQTPQRDVAFG